MVSDLFSRIVRSCHAKCIDDGYYADGQLNKGEGVCIDRLVLSLRSLAFLPNLTKRTVQMCSKIYRCQRDRRQADAGALHSNVLLLPKDLV